MSAWIGFLLLVGGGLFVSKHLESQLEVHPPPEDETDKSKGAGA
jgi:hypothetical protein